MSDFTCMKFTFVTRCDCLYLLSSIVPFLKLPFTFGLMMKLLKIFSDTDSIPDLECEVCDEQTINMLLHRFNINGIL